MDSLSWATVAGRLALSATQNPGSATSDQTRSRGAAIRVSRSIRSSTMRRLSVSPPPLDATPELHIGSAGATQELHSDRALVARHRLGATVLRATGEPRRTRAPNDTGPRARSDARPSSGTPAAGLPDGHRSRARSSLGCQQQVRTLPSAGASTGSGA